MSAQEAWPMLVALAACALALIPALVWRVLVLERGVREALAGEREARLEAAEAQTKLWMLAEVKASRLPQACEQLAARNAELSAERKAGR